MISVISCTNRPNFLKQIIFNFQRQSIKEKELIVILNTNSIDMKTATNEILKYNFSFQIYQNPDEVTLGACLNDGVSKSSYNVIAKFDDDDYYGPNYLNEAYQTIDKTNADLIGKASFYIFFEKESELWLYNPNQEKKWIANKRSNQFQSKNFLSGASLVINKRVFDQINYPHVNIGEDIGFQKKCFFNQMKMYSTSKGNYAYIRYSTPLHHNSDVSSKALKKRSVFITKTNTPNKIINIE